MNKHNTILGQLLDFMSRSRFEKLVKEHKTEHKAKGLRSWTQFIAMLFAQISGQHGLRSIERGLNSQSDSLYHLGIPKETKKIKRSALSYANKHRSCDLFKSLFEWLVGEAQKTKTPHGFRFKNPLYSIDATVLNLCLKLFPWAEFREKKAGIKLTVKLDHQGKIPCFVVKSNAKEHDSKQIRSVPLEEDDIAVFDRGYADYAYFLLLCTKKVHFVTRLKTNAKYRRLRKRGVKKGCGVISDYQIVIPGMSNAIVLRKIIVKDKKTGKRITLLTNNLKWSSATVGAIYRDRWQIELFFKAIKQNLKIKRFYGYSENAVMTQVWIAMIAYLLFYLLKVKSKNMALSFTGFISEIKTMLFQRRSLYEWLTTTDTQPPILDLSNSYNLEFIW